MINPSQKQSIAQAWILLILLVGPASAQTEKGLKDYYRNYFNMGVAVSPKALTSDEAALIARHFNSLTAENAMKMEPIHPAEGNFYWKDADSIVAFAIRHNMKIRGHTLVWHNQVPQWLFTGPDGRKVSRELLLQRLEDHIKTVVTRYRGKISAWDVVNEAVSDQPDEFLRKTPWLEICGEDYIAKAFQWAHEADPDALLFYNDYNEIDPVKRKKILQLVKGLRDRGVPVHGVGLQAHWALNEPSRLQLESTLRDFTDSGLVLHITELDISVYPKEHGRREKRPDEEQVGYTPELEDRQAEMYKMCFELFRKYNEAISSVTFWNVSDRHSWLDNFPVRNRKDFPLLFDSNLKPKKAYRAVVEFEN